MTLNTIRCESIASDLVEPLALQLDDEDRILYVLTNNLLTWVDLSTGKTETVYQHNRKFSNQNMDSIADTDAAAEDDSDQYSQSELSDDEDSARRVSDPFDDSEPSTDDDEESISNRRNWRRYGWRTYQLDNPCSILFLRSTKQLIVLNEGVITFMTIKLENERPFAQGRSKNIFCHEYDVFDSDRKRKGIQPWSITSTSNPALFVFSLLQDSNLYLLDVQNETNAIRKFLSISIVYCPYLVFHAPSNKLFVYDSKQILAVSLDDQTVVNVDLKFLEENKQISSVAVDKIGYIYVLSESVLFKCIWESQFRVVERLGKLDTSLQFPQMIMADQGNQFYLSDVITASIYRLTI